MRNTIIGLALILIAIEARAQTLPDGPGKDTVLQSCSQCHGLRSVVVAKHTRQEWDNVVTDMVSRGAALMEADIPTIVEYLAKSFPKTAATINVNRATSKELAESLRLTPQEADAVVRHRDENGYFDKFQDLGKVAGLDVKKLESAKDRLQY